jgi:hypothetical protein
MMKKKRSGRIFIVVILFSVLFVSYSYAKRILISLDEQYKNADCVVAAVLLDSHTIKVKNSMWEKNIGFTLYEFKVKKDLKRGNYGALVGEIVYVISQTQPEFPPPYEPERYTPKFDSNKEYILFLKETTSYYLFNFVQDFRESIEYNDRIIEKIIK